MNDTKSNFKILTYNTGLLRIKFPFYTYEFTPHLDERLSVLPGEILKLNPDVIALQEIYLEEHKNLLLSKLKNNYPFHFSNTHKTKIWLGDGLLILSKYPISSSHYYGFKKTPLIEKILVKKGCINVTVTLPNKVSLGVINTHTTAGGLLYGPESSQTEKYRLSEQEEIKNIVKTSRNLPYIVLGDFNCSPSVSSGNFNHLLSDGWISTYDALYSDNNELLDEIKHSTWEINNPLNISSPHSNSPNQRIDHIFITPKFNEYLSIVKSEIVLKDPVVFLENPNKKLIGINNITPSDHYGLLTTFKFCK